MLDRFRRPIALGLAVSAAAVTALAFWMSIDGAPRVAADAYTYLAAGERLNDGHHLYELRPDDRWIWINPPYWTVPLLSPPLIGVLWRPLAALPAELGVVVWQLATISVIVATLAALVVRVPIRGSVLLLTLAVPVGFEMDVANVNGLLLGGYTLSWWLFTRERASVGPLVGLMTALKLSPAVLAFWLLTQGRWQAVRLGLLAGIFFLALGILGSSWEMHTRYLGIASQTISGGNTDFSLAGLAVRIGVPGDIAALVPRAVLLLGLAWIFLVRRRPGLAFGSAIVTSVVASPVVNFNTLALLMATLAPVAWPYRYSHRSDTNPSTTEGLPPGTSGATIPSSSSPRKDMTGP